MTARGSTPPPSSNHRQESQQKSLLDRRIESMTPEQLKAYIRRLEIKAFLNKVEEKRQYLLALRRALHDPLKKPAQRRRRAKAEQTRRAMKRRQLRLFEED